MIAGLLSRGDLVRRKVSWYRGNTNYEAHISASLLLLIGHVARHLTSLGFGIPDVKNGGGAVEGPEISFCSLCFSSDFSLSFFVTFIYVGD